MAGSVRLILALGVLGTLGALGGAAAAQEDLPYWTRERLELGGFFGVHVTSDTSALGARAGSAATIASSVAFGARLSYLFRDWLLFEGELPLQPTNTRDGTDDVSVVVIEPRVAARVDGRPLTAISIVPFATAGLGLAIALSGDHQVLQSDFLLRPHLGGGLLFPSERTWHWRVDARLFAIGERGDPLVTPEFELSFSLYRVYGARSYDSSFTRVVEERDGDSDGVPDDRDECVDRDEDRDGFEDGDGCPDIDNDLDLVLDIADRCPNEPEVHNGFEDDDGCADSVPAAVQAIVGTIKRVSFRPGSARMSSSGRRSLRRISRVMTRYGSVRIVVTGHIDGQEAGQHDPDSGGGETGAGRGGPGAGDLSLERARAVREYLVKHGIRAWRVKIEGRGAREPVARENGRRGRAKNRRVAIELRIYGPH